MCHMGSSQCVNKQFSTSINNSKWYYGCNWSSYNNTVHLNRVPVEPSRRPLQSIRIQTCYTLSCSRTKLFHLFRFRRCSAFTPVTRGSVWTTYRWHLGFTTSTNVHVCKLYIIFLFFFLWRCDSTRAMASSFLRFLDHTQRRITVRRTPLDEWSARRRDLYLTTLTTHRHSCPLWDSNPRSQQASGRRPTP